MTKLTFLLAIGLFTWTPCISQDAANTQQKNGERATAGQQRDSYEEKAEARLRELKRKIDALNAQASKQGNEARKQFDRQIADLDRQRVIVQQRLEKLKATSQQAWRDMKPNLEAAMKNLEAAYQRAAADLKK